MAQHAQSEYRDALHNLLPQGMIWPNSSDDSNLGTLLDVVAQALANADGRAHDTLSNMYPDSSGAFFTDWERVLDLPRPGITGQTVAQRVGTILAWLNIDPLSNKQFYVDIAALMGYTVTVEDKNDDGTLAAEQVRINATGVGDPIIFRAGIGSAGDRIIEYPGNEPLEDLILFFRPTGTQIIFNYT
jgi:uncharacterized protein YmfQ (DUF2313 family)